MGQFHDPNVVRLEGVVTRSKDYYYKIYTLLPITSTINCFGLVQFSLVV